MFSTLLTVALLVAPAIQGVFADFAINSPDLVQCKTSRISWEPTKAPYNLIIVKASDPCGDALVDLGDFNKTFLDWPAKIKAGTVVQLSLVDANDQEAWSKNITVGANTDASCLSTTNLVGSSSPAATTTPAASIGTSASDTSSTGVAAPVGAANAGTNPFSSGAITTTQATTPLLALAGLIAAFTML
ncbi:hypothetical protein CVT25_006023 [Psilocybe cyanescens]|uniref:Uncharacterized protein n=1 Tax=Psilocybe cyanescens TaxID=93625 RepID=A0A409VMI9_PSICY|nr:hypothetical protein CVT25_006023 [Psilocybe cyanescens]